jgi:hypothetical protein
MNSMTDKKSYEFQKKGNKNQFIQKIKQSLGEFQKKE